MRDAVFVSYSHRDQEWLERLGVHLRPLARSHNTAIELWDDCRIQPGTAWREEIDAALARTRVALLLVSADFLASDFITEVELPALLQAATANGAVVLPLILSPSRFAATQGLAHLQALNDPARPIIALPRAEQEAVFSHAAGVIEALLRGPATSTEAGTAAPSHATPPLVRIQLADCLRRLGCAEAHLAETERVLRKWVTLRSREARWREEGPDLAQHLKAHSEADAVVRAIHRFAEQLLSWCSPQHARGASIYLSTRKVGEAWRLVRGAAGPAPADESPHERLERIHRYLLETQRLSFLPARLLQGGTLPTQDDEIVYFSGTFELEVDRRELERVPGAAQAFDDNRNGLYAVVAHVFQNPDPLAYPLLRFSGRLGGTPVTMVLSRRNIQFSSLTASTLASALSGTAIEFDGIGTFTHLDGRTELHPLACGAQYG